MIELKKKKQKTKQEVYVYYNLYSGKIQALSYVKNLINDENIEVFTVRNDDKIVSEIYKGNLNFKDYIVDITSNILSSHRLVRKNNILKINQSSEFIKLNPNIDKKIDWDVKIKIYTQNKKLVVSLNKSSIREITKVNSQNEIKMIDDIFLFINIVNSQNENIIKEIKIPIKNLINVFGLNIDISNVLESYDINDIDVYISKSFNYYEYTIVKDGKYIELVNSSLNRITRVPARGKKDSHILLKYDNGILIVINNIGDDLLTAFIDDNINFWIVKDNPNYPVEPIKININDLIYNGKTSVKTNTDLNNDEFDLIHTHSQLIIEKD